jgi:hypothetical protein
LGSICWASAMREAEKMRAQTQRKYKTGWRSDFTRTSEDY